MEAHGAILTADVVHSREINEPEAIRSLLASFIEMAEAKFKAHGDIYRGDSLQLYLTDPRHSMLVAILLRAAFIAQSKSKEQTWDIRVSIGIGALEHQVNKVGESTGEAYILSGTGLDNISTGSDRLKIKTSSTELNTELELLTRFADNLVSSWSHYSAEVVYEQLLWNGTQKELAKKLGRSQPTIHKRLVRAHFELIMDFIDHVSGRIDKEFME